MPNQNYELWKRQMLPYYKPALLDLIYEMSQVQELPDLDHELTDKAKEYLNPN